MGAYRVSEEARNELDGIWLYIVQDSGSIERATRIVEGITARFWKLAVQPYMGLGRDDDLEPGVRSFPAGNYTIFYEIEQQPEELFVHILRVIDARRDLPVIFSKRSSSCC